ncbi:hypothetical protein SAMN05192550_0560 [Flavobacterium glycines]|uniref:Uncharacterized protein n=1 Tax=Flavobacterium glycines TaxID=551990 RepID=A0A511CCJ3_9FLAO|nr:hypothetical protein [Flavobacterium glycines]GEL10406.1 hypothetical protein FGL01_11450 [Flavobacterium glycines]SDI69363.1 hypothetical protein SAMN05192550_0560 [Flavobacterium glycines]
METKRKWVNPEATEMEINGGTVPGQNEAWIGGGGNHGVGLPSTSVS